MPGLFLLYLSIFITLSISYPNAHAVLETKAANIPCLAASKKPPSYQWSQSQRDVLIQYFPAWKLPEKFCLEGRVLLPGQRVGQRGGTRLSEVLIHGHDLGGGSAVGLHPRGWEGINRKECQLVPRDWVLEISAWHTRCTFVGTKSVNAALAIGGKIVANAQKSCKSELLLYFTRKFLH